MKTLRCVCPLGLPALLVWLLSASPAAAFEIDTAISEACHERMTIDAALAVKDRFVRDTSFVTLPLGEDPWSGAASRVFVTVDFLADDEEEKFVIWSFLEGVRSLDTGGHAVTDLDKIRSQHLDPAAQYRHSLRSFEDDGTQGTKNTVNGAINEIRARFAQVNQYLRAEGRDQNIKVEVYTDFYGIVDASVWAPAYYMGQAAHTLQDSFSHTIRSKDLRVIHHALNYVDALSEDHSPTRDGLAHSSAMDRCKEEADEIAQVAQEATEDLFTVIFENDDSLDDQDQTAESRTLQINNARLESFFGRWMQVDTACNHENNFCDSPWLGIAQEDVAEPIMPGWLGCGQTDLGQGQGGVWPWALGLLGACGVGVGWRRRRRRKPQDDHSSR